MRYIKDTPRLAVQYIDAETEEVVFEVNNRNWMNVGELLSDHYVTEVVKQNLGDNAPKNLMVLVIGEYSKSD